jgi:hypothetical protein
MEQASRNGRRFVSGHKTSEEIGPTHDTMRRHAREGLLIEDVHFFRVGLSEDNAKYYWYVDECISNYKLRRLGARQADSEEIAP